ncbi:oxidoreductase [Leptospira fletcheri]|uniref:Oxidoreductase n=1 Tax=Leptospira fletcheri TaxID=2484981 RepID=A0A4R9GDS3_9LEPT|nr:oxidoreductase [Leptospira fletcheri]TGK09893.1 oxidoreductase [Leptospira fletcheri]
MDHRVAIVAGGTGLVGGHLLKELLLDPDWEKVYAFTRRPLSLSHSKLEIVQVDWDRLPDFPPGVTDAFAALGTTMKRAKTKENFRKTDYEYTLSFAKAAKASGVSHFSLVSSLGADQHSLVFYNKVKGEVEEAVVDLKFPYCGIFRPSLLEGDRSEFRFGEKIGSFLALFINPLLIGPARKYRSIQASTVAKAMVNAVWAGQKGTYRMESDRIQELGASSVRPNIPDLLKKIS